MSHSLSEKRRDGGGWLPYHQDRRAVLAPCVGAIGLAQELGEERHGGARCVDREIWRRSLVRSRARSRDMVATTTTTSAATRAHLLRDTDHHDHRAERERERDVTHTHTTTTTAIRWPGGPRGGFGWRWCEGERSRSRITNNKSHAAAEQQSSSRRNAHLATAYLPSPSLSQRVGELRPLSP